MKHHVPTVGFLAVDIGRKDRRAWLGFVADDEVFANDADDLVRISCASSTWTRNCPAASNMLCQPAATAARPFNGAAMG